VIGYRALDGLRMEKGYRYMGTDLTGGDTPYAAGLGFCVAKDKDFTGRDALAGREQPEMRIRTLLVGDEEYRPLYGGEAVLVGGETVARVRSAAYGHTVRRNVAYAYLPAATADDAPVDVEVLGEPVATRLAPDVLVDPQNARIRA
jgi:4-methylaminobutanoate oxidase (formaldehyde-forming)